MRLPAGTAPRGGLRDVLRGVLASAVLVLAGC